MNSTWRWLTVTVLASAIVSFFSACDDGGGGGKPDVGDNDINTVLCIGDSITDGECVPDGASYPSRLSDMAKKKVINAGSCGEKSSGGEARIGALLARHNPGYVCILYGANDAIFGHSTGSLISNLRGMIAACKANKSIPIIATLTPMRDGHAFANGTASDYSDAIRLLAKEEKVRLADLRKEFGDNRDFIQADGLHPSDSGTQLIALTFNDKI